MPESGNQLFKAGTVTGTHGLRGDLKVRPESSGATGLVGASRVVLRSADGREHDAQPLRVTLHKGQYLLRLHGFESIDLAEPLVGWDVWMPYNDLDDLGADENYWYQLEGLEVVDAHCGSLGRLVKMFSTAAHDVYVVEGPYGEVMIPAVEAMICVIDLERGVMDVDLPEGLVAKSDDL